MVIFDKTSKQEIIGKGVELLPSLRSAQALESFHTLGLVPAWKLVPT